MNYIIYSSKYDQKGDNNEDITISLKDITISLEKKSKSMCSLIDNTDPLIPAAR